MFRWKGYVYFKVMVISSLKGFGFVIIGVVFIGGFLICVRWGEGFIV